MKHHNTKHGMSNTVEYNTWHSMKSRCYNKSNESFSNYGSRGIKVCDRWINSFINFYEDMGDRPDGHSLERKNNNGNYTPKNCKWGTEEEQANNRTNSVYFTHSGIRITLAQWAKKVGVHRNLIYDRIRQGWDVKEAIFTPYQHKSLQVKWGGKVQSLSDLAKEYGIKRNTLLKRFRKYKWSLAKSLTTPVLKRSHVGEID